MFETAPYVMQQCQHLLIPCAPRPVSWVTDVLNPLYRGATHLVQDATELYLDLITSLYAHDTVPAVMTWFEARRQEVPSIWLPSPAPMARGQVETYAETTAAQHLHQGLCGLLWGCLSLVEAGEVRLHAYGYEGPTVLARLSAMVHVPLLTSRAPYVTIAKQQWHAIEQAWEDVATSYSALKYHLQEG